MPPVRLLLPVLATSAIVSLVVGAIVRRLAVKWGAVVMPRPDRWHRNPTPTFGGVGVLAGVAAALLFHLDAWLPVWPVLAAGVSLFAIGWYDDLQSLSAIAKMVNSLAVAAFFVVALPTFATSPAQAVLGLAAVVWFGGLDNAVNLLDNMDGLAAGVSAIAAIGLAVTFSHELGIELTIVLLALAGALAGFLFWNRQPARLFMGNCGSLFVGGLLAGCSTIAVLRAGTGLSAAAAALTLMVPIFDTTFVVILRRLAGRSTTRGNVDHTSHRLVSAGFSERRAVMVLYLIGAGGAATGFLLQTRGISTWPLAVVVSLAVLMLGLYLARLPAYAGQDFTALQNASFAPLLSDLTFRWHAAEVLLDLVLITVCYYTAYRIRFEGEALPVFLATFALSLPVVLGCKIAALYTSGLYSRDWNTFGLHDLSTVLRGIVTGSVLCVLAITLLYKFDARFSRSVMFIDAVLLMGAIIATRLSFRVLARAAAGNSATRRRVLIYGAGERGQLLVREMLANPEWRQQPIAFIDDDAVKRARRILGVPVRGSIEDLDGILGVLAIDELLISSPGIDEATESRVRTVCGRHKVPVRRLYFDLR
jgi:UDP-GlcNAc:undecaprenyl-phosphate/decaprenyl-phosphate GlcNAc-1-phosphate transferase